MFENLKKKITTENREKDGLLEWKMGILYEIVRSIIPVDEPYYYDSAFSFLQKEDLLNPVRIDLFLPNFPLAIDIVGREGRPNFLEAQKYISREDWDLLQSNLSFKLERMSAYRCPYLVIRDHDPTDSYSLRDKLRSLTGRNLRL